MLHQSPSLSRFQLIHTACCIASQLSMSAPSVSSRRWDRRKGDSPMAYRNEWQTWMSGMIRGLGGVVVLLPHDTQTFILASCKSCTMTDTNATQCRKQEPLHHGRQCSVRVFWECKIDVTKSTAPHSPGFFAKPQKTVTCLTLGKKVVYVILLRSSRGRTCSRMDFPLRCRN